MNFEGDSFVVLAGDGWTSDSLTTEGITGEALNDAKYNMELAVEARLNVEISEELFSYWDLPSQTETLVRSGDTTYSSITLMDRYAMQTAQKNCFYPMDEIEYVDLSKIYWGGSISDTLSIAGKHYFAVGSFNLSSFKNTALVYVNSVLLSNHGMKVPFEDVYSGTWTFDKFFSYEDIATRDLDGNGMDFEDMYTYGAHVKNISMEMILASGETVVEKDEEDIPVVTIDSNEKIYSVLENVRNVLINSGNSLCKDLESDSDFVIAFNEGRVLFAIERSSALDSLREMEDDFSVLPMPKYDETQENYVSHTYDSMFSMIPVTVEDTEMAGAVLEALSCEGYHSVIPAYVETSLQDKYARNPDSAECIRIAFDTRKIDFGEAFMFDAFGNSAMESMITKRELNYASHFQKIKKATKSFISNILELAD